MAYSIENLDQEAKKQYTEKLQAINFETCPYLLPADVWDNKPTSWPTLEWSEVYDYLINTPGVYTRESMKNRKSLEAQNLFTSGWVRTVLHYKKDNMSKIIVMKAEVIPSQRLND